MSEENGAPNFPGDGFLTLAQAAARAGISEKTLRKRINSGQIEGEKVSLPSGGVAWRVPEAAFTVPEVLTSGTVNLQGVPEVPITVPEGEAPQNTGTESSAPEVSAIVPEVQNGRAGSAAEVEAAVLGQIERRLAHLEGALVGGALSALNERLAALPDVDAIRAGMREEMAQAVKTGISEALEADAQQQAQAASKDDVAAIARQLERLSQQMQTVEDENAVLRRELEAQREKRGLFGWLKR